MTNNKLKIIAIVCMILDHFGYYYYDYIGENIYIVCRIMGRIAMPIFTFLIIEGYSHTSNLKKYILRISVCAFVTQIVMFVLDNIAGEESLNISKIYNILFSYVILLILLKLCENAILKKRFFLKLILAVFVMFVIFLYKNVSTDYGYIVLLLGMLMYLIKKYIKRLFLKNVLYSFLILTVSIIMYFNGNEFMLFIVMSIVPILLYNQELGKSSKVLKYLFYVIFPLQHFLLYSGYIFIK